ncbi:hypothetical protein GLE_1328 [Lysobacter enzymogenes]|uniref:Uncharacterized protein n=1 Tax=Lysobacter enzymogenes TaxID=69 RepID=A0A0S2DEE1_LYSEN|nr:hypothetical protein GLE_1328 [Lysobacter enzymogenes]
MVERNEASAWGQCVARLPRSRGGGRGGGMRNDENKNGGVAPAVAFVVCVRRGQIPQSQ